MTCFKNPFGLLVGMLLLFASVRARAQDTTWFDVAWRKCGADSGVYFRTSVKTDSGWNVVDHYHSGKIQMTGSYDSAALKNRQGIFRFYDEGGALDYLVTYNQGKANGQQVEYWENGRVRVQGNNSGDLRDGTWLAYFESGKLAGKAEYRAGKQTALSLWHENGTPNKKDTIFDRGSEFPGGAAQYTRFLNKTLRYPDSAVVYEIHGTVLLTFKVLKTGKIADLKVMQSVNKYLDEEALRVMRLSPDWQPAILAGVPTIAGSISR